MKTVNSILLKARSREVRILENFEHSLENMQAAVGGLIEAFVLHYDDESQREIVAWLNEEGKMIELDNNLVIIEKDTNKVIDIIVGDVLITASDANGETVGLNEGEMSFLLETLMLSKNPNDNVKIFLI